MQVAEAQPPQPPDSVTVDTQVSETPTATIETTTETVTPVSDRPSVDPDNPIAPEVKALVAAKKNYTTADIVRAQHEAMLATPASAPDDHGHHCHDDAETGPLTRLRSITSCAPGRILRPPGAFCCIPQKSGAKGTFSHLKERYGGLNA